MPDDLLPQPSPLQLWALLDTHLLCAIACHATTEGWLIDGLSVQLPHAAVAVQHNPAADGCGECSR